MKFCGKIGFAKEVASSSEEYPGVTTREYVEKTYFGDVLKNSKRWENGESINDTLTISNRISIVSDKFAYSNIGAMTYVIWMDQKWKITNVDVEYPRLILTLGGVYNA